jgi:hypothetical protein
MPAKKRKNAPPASEAYCQRVLDLSIMAGMEPNEPGRPPPSPIAPKPMGSLPPPVAPPRSRGARSEPPPPVAGFPIDIGAVIAAPATAAGPAFSPEKAITEQLEALDRWVRANRRDGRRAALRYGLLKGPAFLCVVAALVAASLAEGRVVVILTALAALAIAIDTAWSGPSSQAHRRAIADIRDLENAVKLKWDKIRIAHPDPRDPSRSAEALAILDSIHQKRDAIGRSLASQQPSPPIE